MNFAFVIINTVVIISVTAFAKEVVFSSAFVCLLAGLYNTTRPNFRKFGGKAARGQWKKQLDFGGTPYNIGRVRVTVRQGIIHTACH